MYNVAVLGSTGSIGTQTLEVVDANRDSCNITLLSAYNNDILLERQIEKYKPRLAVLADKTAAERLAKRYKGPTRLYSGEEGLLEALEQDKTSQTVLIAMVGFSGVRPTLAAIKAGKRIALANKETLVAAGEIVTAAAKQHKVEIIPVDSEHSAIFQCLQGEKRQNINKLIITASGGPFRGYTSEQLKNVTVAECLKHPNWSMGQKITVDSATLINKGLEIIEARWLFDMPYDKIEAVIHPQSIIHSMVEYIDGSIIAQAGLPDIRLPIQYALFYPERIKANFPRLVFSQSINLSFIPLDIKTFSALDLAYKAGNTGGTMPAVFNAANETAVAAFLVKKISFTDIVDLVAECVKSHRVILQPELENIFRADCWAREYVLELVNKL